MNRRIERLARRVVVIDPDSTTCCVSVDAVESSGYIFAGLVGSLDLSHERLASLRPDVVLIHVAQHTGEELERVAALAGSGIAPVVGYGQFSDPGFARDLASVGLASWIEWPLQDNRLFPALEIACSSWNAVEQVKRRVDMLVRSEARRDLIDCAKRALIQHYCMSESGAYEYLRKRSMDQRRTMAQTAEVVLKQCELLDRVDERFGNESFG